MRQMIVRTSKEGGRMQGKGAQRGQTEWGTKKKEKNLLQASTALITSNNARSALSPLWEQCSVLRLIPSPSHPIPSPPNTIPLLSWFQALTLKCAAHWSVNCSVISSGYDYVLKWSLCPSLSLSLSLSLYVCLPRQTGSRTAAAQAGSTLLQHLG